MLLPPTQGRGSLWYDPNLNFITKVQRTSKAGVPSGFELTNVVGTQPTSLFEIPSDYRKCSLLLCLLTCSWTLAKGKRNTWSLNGVDRRDFIGEAMLGRIVVLITAKLVSPYPVSGFGSLHL